MAIFIQLTLATGSNLALYAAKLIEIKRQLPWESGFKTLRLLIPSKPPLFPHKLFQMGQSKEILKPKPSRGDFFFIKSLNRALNIPEILM